MTPGSPFPVPFSVMTNGPGGNFTIRATNNRRFSSTSPSSLILETGKSSNGTVTISAPRNTPSGTDVTLTIEAVAPGGVDTNYVVLRFSIVNPVIIPLKILLTLCFTVLLFLREKKKSGKFLIIGKSMNFLEIVHM